MSNTTMGKLLRQFRSDAEPADQFVTMLQETIRKMHPPRKPSASFKPSSLGTCLRRNYYELTGAAINNDPVSDELIGMGESGTDRHTRLQKYVQQMRAQGFDCDWVDVEAYLQAFPRPGVTIRRRQGAEVGLAYEPLGLHLFLDGLIKLNGTYYVLEFKTEASFKWQARKAPEPLHIIQVTCYALVMGLSDVIILYESRDTCRKKAYRVTITGDQKQALRLFIERVRGYVALKTLPPRTEDQTNCKYCPYTQICDRAGDTVAIEDGLLGMTMDAKTTTGEDV